MGITGIIDKLVEQCKQPKGLLGITMIKIMNIADSGLTRWALSQINFTNGKILDIGCGGGKTIYMLSKRYPKANIFGIDYSEVAVKAATHYFWPSLKTDIQEVFRKLNKGGHFLILSEVFKINYHMKQYNTNASLKQLLKDIGFKSVEIFEKNQCICVVAVK